MGVGSMLGFRGDCNDLTRLIVTLIPCISVQERSFKDAGFAPSGPEGLATPFHGVAMGHLISPLWSGTNRKFRFKFKIRITRGQATENVQGGRGSDRRRFDGVSPYRCHFASIGYV